MSNCDHVWAIEGCGAEARPGQCLNCGKRFDASTPSSSEVTAEVTAERIRSHAKALVEAESLRARLRTAEAEVAQYSEALAAARDRAEQAEAERDELRRRFAEMATKADAWSYAARALERADAAEAEVARLRGAREAALRRAEVEGLVESARACGCGCDASSPALDRLAQLALEATAMSDRTVPDLAAVRALLREVYESQPAACVGGGTTLPCGSCLWCRVRAGLEGE